MLLGLLHEQLLWLANLPANFLVMLLTLLTLLTLLLLLLRRRRLRLLLLRLLLLLLGNHRVLSRVVHLIHVVRQGGRWYLLLSLLMRVHVLWGVLRLMERMLLKGVLRHVHLLRWLLLMHLHVIVLLPV